MAVVFGGTANPLYPCSSGSPNQRGNSFSINPSIQNVAGLTVWVIPMHISISNTSPLCCSDKRRDSLWTDSKVGCFTVGP